MCAKKTTKATTPRKKAEPTSADATNVDATNADATTAEVTSPKTETKPVKKTAAKTTAKAKAVPAVKEEAAAPAIKEDTPPMVKKEAAAPAVKEKAAAPMVKETVMPVVQESKSTKSLTPIVAPGAIASNPYMPYVATVAEVIEETHNIKTFRVIFDDAEAMKKFSHQPGQVGQLSIFGVGESTFVINSPPSQKEYLQFSVMRTGEVTNALHKLSAGDKVGVRAPLGNSFPFEDWKGKDVFFVGGGIGMAPIRTIMLHVLENKADYGKVSLLYGGRSPRDLAYSYELDGWLSNKDLDCTLTIDNPAEGWPHKVGLIPHVLTDLAPNPANTVAVLCGPPIMIKFTVEALKKMNFSDENIITTLEKRMKCGIGICGRCNIGSKYVCVDGPVFSWAELKDLPPEL